MRMPEELAMKLFVTRWVILAVICTGVGLIIDGITYATKKEEQAYKGMGFWLLYCLLLTALHTGAFMYNRTFSHWAVCIGAGLMIGYVATTVVKWIGGWLSVKLLRVYAVASAVLFPLVIWLGAEKWLLECLNKMPR